MVKDVRKSAVYKKYAKMLKKGQRDFAPKGAKELAKKLVTVVLEDDWTSSEYGFRDILEDEGVIEDVNLCIEVDKEVKKIQKMLLHRLK